MVITTRTFYHVCSMRTSWKFKPKAKKEKKRISSVLFSWWSDNNYDRLSPIFKKWKNTPYSRRTTSPQKKRQPRKLILITRNSASCKIK